MRLFSIAPAPLTEFPIKDSRFAQVYRWSIVLPGNMDGPPYIWDHSWLWPPFLSSWRPWCIRQTSQWPLDPTWRLGSSHPLRQSIKCRSQLCSFSQTYGWQPACLSFSRSGPPVFSQLFFDRDKILTLLTAPVTASQWGITWDALCSSPCVSSSKLLQNARPLISNWASPLSLGLS